MLISDGSFLLGSPYVSASVDLGYSVLDSSETPAPIASPVLRGVPAPKIPLDFILILPPIGVASLAFSSIPAGTPAEPGPSASTSGGNSSSVQLLMSSAPILSVDLGHLVPYSSKTPVAIALPAVKSAARAEMTLGSGPSASASGINSSLATLLLSAQSASSALPVSMASLAFRGAAAGMPLGSGPSASASRTNSSRAPRPIIPRAPSAPSSSVCSIPCSSGSSKKRQTETDTQELVEQGLQGEATLAKRQKREPIAVQSSRIAKKVNDLLYPTDSGKKGVSNAKEAEPPPSQTSSSSSASLAKTAPVSAPPIPTRALLSPPVSNDAPRRTGVETRRMTASKASRQYGAVSKTVPVGSTTASASSSSAASLVYSPAATLSSASGSADLFPSKFSLPMHKTDANIGRLIHQLLRHKQVEVKTLPDKLWQQLSAINEQVQKNGLPNNLRFQHTPKIGGSIVVADNASPIQRGELIVAYSGVVELLSDESYSDSCYLFDLVPDIELNERQQKKLDPKNVFKKDRTYFLAVNADKEGNFSRFVNDPGSPKQANVRAECYRIPAKWLGGNFDGLAMIYFARKVIYPKEELLLSYGSSYWKNLQKTPLKITSQTHLLNP